MKDDRPGHQKVGLDIVPKAKGLDAEPGEPPFEVERDGPCVLIPNIKHK
jgi:hypothetical protein